MTILFVVSGFSLISVNNNLFPFAFGYNGRLDRSALNRRGPNLDFLVTYQKYLIKSYLRTSLGTKLLYFDDIAFLNLILLTTGCYNRAYSTS